MASVSYVVNRDYSGGVNGKRVAWLAGDIVRVDLDDVGPLVRDAGADVVDWAQPLSDDDAAALRRQRDEAAAVARAEDDEALRLRVVREHVKVWGGPVCPGRAGAKPMPIGYSTDGPHAERVDDLHAGTNAGGDVVVGCPGHLPHLVAMDVVPRPAVVRDTTMRRYRVAHRYASALTEYDPSGPFGSGTAPRRLEFAAGEVVEVAVWIAEWVNRDSPGALEPEE